MTIGTAAAMRETDTDIPLQAASVDIWAQKYRLTDKAGKPVDQTVDDTYKRIAKALSAVETKNQKVWEEQFLWALRNGCLPAGRIISNAGAEEYKPSTSTINCTVSSTLVDSMKGILKGVEEGGITLAAGCGIGYDFSTLRPNGAFVAGVGANTSGALSFMDIYDKMCFTVSSAGGRRGAQMGTLDVSHPDVFEFIKAKREDGRLRQFNLSLLITDAFIKAVTTNSEWDLVFPINKKEVDLFAGQRTVARDWPYTGDNMITDEDGKVICRVYRTVKARDIWDLIMQSTYNYAEPGFILIDKMNSENNNWFCETIRATNPCVPGDTLILTDFGYMRIDGCLNAPVNIWNGKEWSEVQPRVTGHNQKMVKVTLSDGGELVCTTGHVFHMKGGNRVSAVQLEAGDALEKFSFPVVEAGFEVPEKVAYTQGVYSGDGSSKKGTGKKEIWLYGPKTVLLPFLDYTGEWRDKNKDRTQVCISGSYLDKDYVPMQWSKEARLSWFAGLMDTDGAVNSECGSLAVSSVNKEFLLSTKLMLTTLGVSSTVSLMKEAGTKQMPDGKGGHKEYNCTDCYRLSISARNVEKLLAAGLKLHRLAPNPSTNRDAGRFVKVVKVEEVQDCETVYCFTDPKNHTGTFNGVVTGNCGEQGLPPYGACLLGSVNLTKFIKNPFSDKAEFDEAKFTRAVGLFTRMLDNVVEINGLPLEQQRHEIQNKRRHGMGFLGLGSALAMMKIKYGSEKSLVFTEKVSKLLAITGWATGVDLAIEKGAAPIMDEDFVVTQKMMDYMNRSSDFYAHGGVSKGDVVKGRVLFSQSEYMQRVFAECPGLREKIMQFGCRFTHHTSIAPTGTIALSLANNASNGIEPSFAHEYTRNVIKEGRAAKEAVTVRSYEALLFREISPQLPLPEYFADSGSIGPRAHVDVQAAAQKWIDSAISKTINVPSDFPFEEFQSVYMYAYQKGLKGCTTFRFNPEAFQGVLVTTKDLESTDYTFTLEDGSEVTLKGNEEVEYNGQTQTAANLYDALKEGYYGKH